MASAPPAPCRGCTCGIDKGVDLRLLGRSPRPRTRSVCHLNLPQSRVTEPVDALANFSYVPGGIGLTEIPLEQVLWQHKNPTIQFTEPSGPPEVVWFYSKRQRLLVVVCYEMIEQESVSNPPRTPDPRVIERIDWFGAVATHGYVPYRKGVAVHAYLLPFGDLKIENLDRHSNEDPDLRLFNYALPLVLPSNYAGFIIPPEVTTPETFAWLRAEAAAPFYQTRATLRSLAVVCAFWLLFGSWCVGRLRQRYHAWVEVCLPGTQKGTSRRLGFREFLSGEIERIARHDIARAVERHHGVLAGRRQQDEKQNLADELLSLRDAVELTGPQRTQLDRARSEGSLEEMQKLVGVYGSLIDQRRGSQPRRNRNEIGNERSNDWRLNWRRFLLRNATPTRARPGTSTSKPVRLKTKGRDFTC
jgi:hypothetical protein